MARAVLVPLFLSAVAGCAPALEPVEGAGPMAPEGDPKIYGGDPPDAPYHDAVVGLHQLSKRWVYTTPFCSGTLIGEEWVLTAAHCVVSGRKAMGASKVAVYVGDDPSADLVDHLYEVDQVVVHSAYNGSTLRNDVALLHLAGGGVPSSEATPVPYLPDAKKLTSADIGQPLNHAGFGYDETGGYGVKLQVDVDLGGFGCAVDGCPSAGDAATQISYDQDGGATGIGPCNGDSGGPAFVLRSGTAYVAGITSYGDAGCDVYGVSTRVDAFGSWIHARTGL